MVEHALGAHFSSLADPRVSGRTDHRLLDIVAIAICALVCGADGWVQVAEFGRRREAWLRTFLELPSGIPSHDTFGRVFALLDPQAFRDGFIAWSRAVAGAVTGVVAVDGKCARGSYDSASGKGAIHVVSAWARTNGVVLGQVKTDDKSNEITAIPELLRLLDLAGCLVTLDAMGCQTAVAQTVLDQGADYLLAVKDNQETLANDIQEEFQAARRDGFAHLDHTYHQTLDKDHGRVEVRECWHTPDVSGIDPKGRWPKLSGMTMCRCTRTVDGHESVETRYYITSRATLTAEQALEAARGHWGIENSVHWVLDVVFGEDACRVRAGHADENLATVRRLALNLLKQDRTVKGGVQTKRLAAALDPDYLKTLLNQLLI